MNRSNDFALAGGVTSTGWSKSPIVAVPLSVIPVTPSMFSCPVMSMAAANCALYMYAVLDADPVVDRGVLESLGELLGLRRVALQTLAELAEVAAGAAAAFGQTRSSAAFASESASFCGSATAGDA